MSESSDWSRSRSSPKEGKQECGRAANGYGNSAEEDGDNDNDNDEEVERGEGNSWAYLPGKNCHIHT